MGERMMVAAGGQAHGLAVLAEAVRRHNAREIIQKPGKPAAQQDDREQQLQLLLLGGFPVLVALLLLALV